MNWLRRKLSQKPDDPKHDWFIIAYATGLVEAEIIAGLLRTADIPVYVQQESVGRAIGLNVGPLGVVRVLVPVSYKEEAEALLDSPTVDDLPPQLDEPPIQK